MPLPKPERTLRMAVALLAGLVILAGCGQRERREAEVAAAPVRHVVEQIAAQRWPLKPGRCLCVGFYRDEGVGDFPSGVLDDQFARHRWLRNWSECAPLYERKNGLAGCQAGMTDYVCGVVPRPGQPPGKARVLCHVNGRNELFADEFDVARDDAGGLAVTAVTLKAAPKLHEQ